MTQKTFIVYSDRIDYTEEMSLDEQWLFYRTIFRYYNWIELWDIASIKFIRSKVKCEIDRLNNEETFYYAFTLTKDSESFFKVWITSNLVRRMKEYTKLWYTCISFYTERFETRKLAYKREQERLGFFTKQWRSYIPKNNFAWYTECFVKVKHT